MLVIVTESHILGGLVVAASIGAMETLKDQGFRCRSSSTFFHQMDNEHDTEVDTALSATQVPAKHCDEMEIYCCLLALMFLFDQKKYKEALLQALLLLLS